jgi:hypothetical protein
MSAKKRTIEDFMPTVQAAPTMAAPKRRKQTIFRSMMTRSPHVAVIGSRTFTSYEFLKEKLRNETIGTIISGGAIGADTLVARYARENSLGLLELIPDWSKGRAAGLMRNTQIIEKADRVIAFWDRTSRGTKDSIDKAIKMGKPLVVHYISLKEC